ncbi:MAG: ribosomal protein S18-alanine N-acetyltransferase [Clostridia bacterium]|nr:ribosomal protein S18-alanine N-acetyltransferase [Clostridia bacterium]
MTPNDELIFSPLCPTHIDDMEAIEVECFSVPWSREALEDELDNPYARYVVCTDTEGNVVGYIGSRIVLDSADITNVAVRPRYRRRGIGFELVTRMLEQMKALGVASVLLEVRESNLPAQNCYARAGFAVVGRRKNYYELPKEDALLMGRELL